MGKDRTGQPQAPVHLEDIPCAALAFDDQGRLIGINSKASALHAGWRVARISRSLLSHWAGEALIVTSAVLLHAGVDEHNCTLYTLLDNVEVSGRLLSASRLQELLQQTTCIQ